MAHILKIAFAGEGNTDKKLLPAIIKRTFEGLAFNCQQQIDILDIDILDKVKGDFNNEMATYARKAAELSANILCVHTDADAENSQKVLEHKINPAFAYLAGLNQAEICTNYFPVIPVYMSESWLFADLDLLKEQLYTELSNQKLGFVGNPEHFYDPKAIINNAISILKNEDRKRYKNLTINDLYQMIGQTIDLNKLELLSSYLAFKADAEQALKKLNFCK
jgi:Domain of unknown function (DUF4276)